MPRQCAQSAAYLIRPPQSRYTNIIPSAEAHISLRGEKSAPSRREMYPIAEGKGPTELIKESYSLQKTTD